MMPPLAPRKQDTPTDDVVKARRIMWLGWVQECAEMHDAFVEAMLANMPAKDVTNG